MLTQALTFTQDQEPKERRVIHLKTADGGMYGVPEVYDLPLAPQGDTAAVYLVRPPNDGVEIWRGPIPLARALASALVQAIEHAESGVPVDVAALAATLTPQGTP